MSARVIIFVLLLPLCLIGLCHAGLLDAVEQLRATTAAQSASRAQLPSACLRYQADIARAVRSHFTHPAQPEQVKVSHFAAQLAQESACNPLAISHVGAQGLAQFMPATSAWFASVTPDLGPPAPRDPRWAIPALVKYDHWLFAQMRGATYLDRLRKTLWAYNGGQGWVMRDERLAASKGLNPLLVSDLRPVNAGRSPANFAENRHYDQRIIDHFAPRFLAAGWN